MNETNRARPSRRTSPAAPTPAGSRLTGPATLLIALALGVAAPALPVAGGPAVAQTAGPYAEAPAPVRFAEAVEEARSMAVETRLRAGIPGMAVAVGVDGELAWAEGFGYADVEQRAPVWPNTKFRIGSVSKPLTAVAVARLWEEGRLDLDVPVQSYVPSFPEKRWTITTRQLAGHVAGVRHYRDQEFLIRDSYPTVEEGLAIFEDDTLLFEPGTDYNYSTYGWNLVSAVVEGAAGTPFLRYMRTSVIEPLDLDETVADHPDSVIFHRTDFYDRGEDARLLNAPYVDNSYKWAGGGYLSTAPDLVRFGLAHLEPGILEPETVETLWTSQETSDGEATGYGIGWRVAEDEEGRRIVGHGGGSVGGTTALVIYPDEGVVVAITSNLGRADFDNLHRRVAELFLEALESEES